MIGFFFEIICQLNNHVKSASKVCSGIFHNLSCSEVEMFQKTFAEFLKATLVAIKFGQPLFLNAI